MTPLEDVLWRDATAQAELVRQRELAPGELVEAAIRRTEQLEPALGVLATPTFARALDVANTASGPFAGVPMLLKDLAGVQAGVRQTNGCRALRDFVPTADEPLVERYAALGLVSIGKSRASEFGLLITCEPLVYGPTRNPWAPGASPGGSSGGAAAAVAAGLVPVAHGNDAGGSLRIPAACCGLVGFRPGRGRMPLPASALDLTRRLAAQHVLTRSVRDCAAVWELTRGATANDPYRRDGRPEPDGSVARPRVAVMLDSPFGGDVDPAARAAVARTAAALEGLGATLDPCAPAGDGEAFVAAYAQMWAVLGGSAVLGARAALGREVAGDGLEPFTRALAELAASIDAVEYLATLDALEVEAERVHAPLHSHDVLLTPTLARTSWPVGALDGTGTDVAAVIGRMLDIAPFTGLVNVAGLPAVSLPCGEADGAPVGVQLIGGAGAEPLLLALAERLEAALPWAQRRPGLRAVAEAR